MRCLVGLMLSLLSLVGAAGVANADPLTWTLQGVTLADTSGAAVTGSFVYDFNTNTYSGVNIHTVNNNYDPTDRLIGGSNCMGVPDNCNSSTRLDIQDLTSGWELILRFAGLTNAGGSVALNPLAVPRSAEANDSVGLYGYYVQVNGGSVVANATVPEPTALLLLGMMGALVAGASGLLKRRLS